jgi:hypothetical protein
VNSADHNLLLRQPCTMPLLVLALLEWVGFEAYRFCSYANRPTDLNIRIPMQRTIETKIASMINQLILKHTTLLPPIISPTPSPRRPPSPLLRLSRPLPTISSPIPTLSTPSRLSSPPLNFSRALRSRC